MTTQKYSINNFMKDCVIRVSKCLKSSLDLPIKGNLEDNIFNDFPQYKKVLNGLSLKVLNNIQQLINKQDGKGNLSDSAEKKSLEEKFNILVEVNDRLLDKCNNTINSIENPNAQSAPQMIIVEYKNVQPQDGTKMTPKQTIKLLSSVQVERPQIKFSKIPDNSVTPFKPILTKKPNSIVPLENNLINNNDDNDEYPHPYNIELETFKIPETNFICRQNSEFPKSLEETPYEFIDSIENLKTFIGHLKNEKEISVDLEHHNVRTFLGLTCLIQISTRSSDFIIDSLALHDHLEILNEIFTDSSILKVFHGSNSDLMWLQRDFGVYVVNMFDTGHACQALNFSRKSLSYLLSKYCQIQANKEYQKLTDWRIRPLIPELIEYARTDTHYLLYIYDKLKIELIEKNLLNDVFDSSNKLCYKLYKKPICDLDECMELYKKSSENFNPRQLYALKRLWELRDNIAREEDESPQFVLPNRILLSIAQALPREASGVLACCSQDWKLPLLRKNVYDFQKICLEAYNESLTAKEKKVKVSKNVLDILLSKHDRTETVKEDIEIDIEEIEKKMKNQETIMWKNWTKSEPFDISMVRLYLSNHSIETIARQTEIDQIMSAAEQEEEEVEVEEEEMESEHQSDLEIVECSQPERSMVIDLTEEKSFENLSDSFDLNNRKRQNVDNNNRESVAEKKQKTVPFDYEKSLAELKKTSSNKPNEKQFKPFLTKKFKGKQNKRNFKDVNFFFLFHLKKKATNAHQMLAETYSKAAP